MENIFELEAAIRKEADHILYSKKLIELLNQYGRAELTGSYPLHLMCKKDLDISLVNAKLQPDRFFQLGSEIVSLIKPHSVYYRNTRVQPVKNRPIESLYFGLLFKDWKIDLWVIDEDWWNESQEYSNRILGNLTEAKRLLILKIKQHYNNSPEYGKLFSSKEIYKLVIDNKISSLKEFRKNIWLGKAYKHSDNYPK